MIQISSFCTLFQNRLELKEQISFEISNGTLDLTKLIIHIVNYF